MADYEDDKNPKRGLSNNFLLFLIAAIVIIMMMQNLLETKSAKVSFSYQLESLVNLDLIQPQESRKTAINDNLVTFSGRFRNNLTKTAKERYKYLELLDEYHQVQQQRREIAETIDPLRQKVITVADLYLHLSGKELPGGGYKIVDSFHGPIDKKENITITSLSDQKFDSFSDLQKEFSRIEQEVDLSAFREQFSNLIGDFQSPALGIGDETMKRTLRELQTLVQSGQVENYQTALNELGSVIKQLDQEIKNYRLSQLRSVRNYEKAINTYNGLFLKSDELQAKLNKASQPVSNVIWYFNNQELSTRSLEKEEPELFHQWFLTAKEEWDQFPKNKGAFFQAPDQPLNAVLKKTFRSQEPPPKYLSYLFPALLAFGVIILLYVLFARQMKGVGSNAMNFGKSPAKMISPKGDDKVTFKDVAGIDEALEELEEIVEFLKNPKKFTSLGGKIPKGVLCVGPPGTGKTLVAKAVAGEANRPFFSISGSDFVEMFVGVGASRIRDLFEQAKKHAPCIIFMDEIDAVGRHRGAGIGGGHDEREQTLNQLLVEMDGFDTNEGVILMAATNRPDVLDKALLRPGRFDRQVVIGYPDLKGRYEILKVHAKKIKMDTSVDLMQLARSTPGCSGADLANMLNESALLAARKSRTAVTMQEIMEARDKVLYGKERRSLELDEQEKKTTAYHESGHAIVGLVVENGDPVDKVTIIPRGVSLGATLFMPEKNKVSYWKKELRDRLAVLMGGRCAEDVFVGDISSGAQQDIEQATHLARSMVCEWGMSEKLGAVAYDERADSGKYLGMTGHHEKKYSEATAEAIDEEVKKILDDANKMANQIISDNRDKVELMTSLLMKYETLDSEDLDDIMKGTWDDLRKEARIKEAEELHKQAMKPPPPPPPMEEEEKPKENPGDHLRESTT